MHNSSGTFDAGTTAAKLRRICVKFKLNPEASYAITLMESMALLMLDQSFRPSLSDAKELVKKSE